ncbi:hydrogenase formation protein HypD [Burkholderiaceae bacterium FT117]|uniref:hypothetical protein n=1 Tax=Zeimonas sediminis TaxID=2944268 RepID=UPI002342D77D|nr:hypothetical protein [Zeimonas sediminis]MCM5570070.1 hydrogenase formation protein HypD [Zeimonas sediminis]
MPIVVTGFEPVDILQGVLAAVRQLDDRHACVDNRYARSVRPEGNPSARALVDQVFEPVDRDWRGLGPIARGGLALRPAYRRFDASLRHRVLPEQMPASEHGCIAGLVLRGARRPPDCARFGTACTPDHPLGAPMVSAEGACSAWYRYRRDEIEVNEAR